MHEFYSSSVVASGGVRAEFELKYPMRKTRVMYTAVVQMQIKGCPYKKGSKRKASPIRPQIQKTIALFVWKIALLHPAVGCLISLSQQRG
jgi:hypothetical protein